MILRGLPQVTIDYIHTLIDLPERNRKSRYEVLSLGGGVQSSCLWLMNIAGLIEPRAEFAVFSDTMYERKGTHLYLDYLDEVTEKAGFPPIMKVTAGNIREDMVSERKNVNMPVYTETGRKGGGRLSRQCSGYYKIEVVRREIRRLFGMKKYTQWIGFSLDEIKRRNDERFPQYITPRYPLLELRWTRKDCKQWLKENGHPEPIKSSCIACPFRSNKEWKEMKENSPEEFQDAVEFDRLIRHRRKMPKPKPSAQLTLFPDVQLEEPSYDIFVHRERKPLDQVDLSNIKESEEDDTAEQCQIGCFL